MSDNQYPPQARYEPKPIRIGWNPWRTTLVIVGSVLAIPILGCAVLLIAGAIQALAWNR